MSRARGRPPKLNIAAMNELLILYKDQILAALEKSHIIYGRYLVNTVEVCLRMHLTLVKKNRRNCQEKILGIQIPQITSEEVIHEDEDEVEEDLQNEPVFDDISFPVNNLNRYMLLKYRDWENILDSNNKLRSNWTNIFFNSFQEANTEIKCCIMFKRHAIFNYGVVFLTADAYCKDCGNWFKFQIVDKPFPMADVKICFTQVTRLPPCRLTKSKRHLKYNLRDDVGMDLVKGGSAANLLIY